MVPGIKEFSPRAHRKEATSFLGLLGLGAFLAFASAVPVRAQLPKLLSDINPGIPGSEPPGTRIDDLVVLDGFAYFFAKYPLSTSAGIETRVELWRTDGTGEGTTLVTDALTVPIELTAAGAYLYFSDTDPVHGRELWVSDGTAEGTKMLEDINPDRGSFPEELTAVRDRLFFVANGPKGREIYRTDGRSVSILEDINPFGGSAPRNLTYIDGSNGIPFQGGLYFSANDGSGQEPWLKPDDRGIHRLEDLVPGRGSSAPTEFTRYKDEIYFTANDPLKGRELYRLGRGRVTDINKDEASSNPEFLTVANDLLFFAASDGNVDGNLWKWDGHQASPIGVGILGVEDIVARDDGVFFVAIDDADDDVDLWFSDGTTTEKIRINMGGDSDPSELVAIGSRYVWFSARDGVNGYELWKSGRIEGKMDTELVANLVSGPTSSRPSNMVLVNGKLVFRARGILTGRELWAVPAGATAQTGDCFGEDCPTLECTDPVIGRPMRFSGHNAPRGSFGFVFLGTPLSGGETRSNSFPDAQMDLTKPVTIGYAFKVEKHDWSFEYTVPNDPSLGGKPIAIQVMFAPTPNPGGYLLTNAVIATLGK